jgi:hypothetical protein
MSGMADLSTCDTCGDECGSDALPSVRIEVIAGMSTLMCKDCAAGYYMFLLERIGNGPWTLLGTNKREESVRVTLN